MTTSPRAHSSMLVSAGARWAGGRSPAPVRGEAWFVGLPMEAAGGRLQDRGLSAWLARAADAYPAMFSAVERIDRSGEALVVRLRLLEVFEDDVANAGLGDLRRALGKRAEVCGMRMVACVNALAGAATLHGMPLDRDPTALPRQRIDSMLDELALMEVLREPSEESGEGAKRL